MSKSVKVTMFVVLSAALILTMMTMLISAGCSSSSSDAPAVVAENSVVVAKAPFTGAANGCTNGGISVTAGIDDNGNGTLDAAEVDSTQYVCNGADGANGTNGTDGTAGTAGADGTAGAAGASVTLTAEPAGVNCQNGGTKVSVAGGVPPVSYVCNGTATWPSIPQGAVGQKYTVFLDSILPDANYKYLHGSTDPSGTKMFLVVNKSATPQGVMNGVSYLFIVDAIALETGQVVKLLGPVAIGTADGKAAKTTFRSNWTADGTKILLSGGDRFWVIDSATLASKNGVDGKPDLNLDPVTGSTSTWFHNHDALATTDGKYAILTLRTKPAAGSYATPTTNKGNMDGELKLFDLTNNSPVGKGVSVCDSCHVDGKNSVLCGLDGIVALSSGSTTTYSGTVYVAGHGGHVAKVVVSIDPANANPISVSALTKLTVSTLKFPSGTSATADGTSQYKLHDVRLDGTSLYWSTYNTDINMKAHYGKINLTTNAVTDTAEPIPARATNPAAGVDKMPIYCGSGQTANAFMPMTMTNEAYITVIPKF